MNDLNQPPRSVAVGTMPPAIARNIRIIDAETGEPIEKVIAADADSGAVRRFAIEEGNLVREDGAFLILDEVRPIRIEWIVPPAAEAVAGPEDAG